MNILNMLGHAFRGTKKVILRPVATELVSKEVLKTRAARAQKAQRNQIRHKNGKPILRITAGMKMRDFFKVAEDGTILAYTPKAVNNNPNCPDCFHLGLYESPTGVFMPKEHRQKK